MDQSAFRSLLLARPSSSSTSSSTSSKNVPTASAPAFGLQRKRVASLHSSSHADDGRSSSSLEQFKPRGQQQQHRQQQSGVDDNKSNNKGKQKERDAFRRFGYTDRASLRRAEAEQQARDDEEERRPRGLDLSLLDPSKRALLSGKDETETQHTTNDVDFRDHDGSYAGTAASSVPLKTDEEIERELEAAEQELDVGRSSAAAGEPGHTGNTAGPSAAARNHEKADFAVRPKKRSRAEMLRDLQAKLAASASGATTTAPENTAADAGPSTRSPPPRHSTNAASVAEGAIKPAAAAATIKGFKPVAEKPAKNQKKNSKKRKNAEMDGDDSLGRSVHPKEISAPPSKRSVPIDTSDPKNGMSLQTEDNNDDDDDDGDIFAGAGQYEVEYSDSDKEAEGGDDKANEDGEIVELDTARRNASSSSRADEENGDPSSAPRNAGKSASDRNEPRRQKYLEDDQEEIIPKFQTWRSPSPNHHHHHHGRQEREGTSRKDSRRRGDDDVDGGRSTGHGDDDDEDLLAESDGRQEDEMKKKKKPQRLEGLSGSSSARDLLAYDEMQSKEEKRKLKKLKGREKKEALAREAEFASAKDKEAREKDRLNREVQEYEKYERRKQQSQAQPPTTGQSSTSKP